MYEVEALFIANLKHLLSSLTFMRNYIFNKNCWLFRLTFRTAFSLSGHLSCLFVLLFITVMIARSQTASSGITGKVTDQNGAVVTGATVKIKNEDTGIVYAQETSRTGVYAFSSVAIGKYTITVEHSEYKTFIKTSNYLGVNTTLRLDIALTVGEISEKVFVQAETEQLKLSDATIGNIIERNTIESLPLNGRNPLNLIVLEPGVVQRSQGAAGSGVHINGSRDRAFNITIDGIDANESSAPNPVSNLYRLNPDNIQEYKVTTNNARPEEGRNSGASISIATRAGTNEFHGTAFYFLRNDALNTNEFFSNAQGLPKPKLQLNQYGFELGGPVQKNKTFFFGSYQGNSINFSTPIDKAIGGVPIVYTPTARAGIFRYFVADPNNPFILNDQIITRNTPLLVDRNTGALQPGVRNCSSPRDTNCVASYNIFANDPQHIGPDPVISNLLNTYPLPNTYAFGDGLNTGGFFWNTPAKLEGPALMIRIDHTFNENSVLFVRWLQSRYNTRGGDPLNFRPRVFPDFPPLGEVFRNTKNMAVSYCRVVSPRIINEFTTGFSRFGFLFTQGEANPAFPNVPPFDFTNLTEPFGNAPRNARFVTVLQLLDNLSVLKGNNLYKVGFNFRFYKHVDQRGQLGGINLTPAIIFDQGVRPPTSVGFITPQVASGINIGINPADQTRLFNTINELLGIPAQITQAFLGDLNNNAFLPFSVGNQVSLQGIGTRINQLDFYFQDEWKYRQNLTITYGVRWEINPAPVTVGGRTYVPNSPIVGMPSLATPVVGAPGSVTFVRASRWFNRNNLGAVAPRLGIAWSPHWKSSVTKFIFGSNGQSVLRLGYGIAFDPISSFQVTAAAGRVPGLITTCSSIVDGGTTSGCVPAPNVRISQGFPQQLAPPSIQPSSFLTPPLQLYRIAPSVIVFDPQLKLPTVHQWNYSIQRALPFGLIAEAAYIGRRGNRLLRAYDANQISADPILPSFLLMQQNVRNGCRPDGSGTLNSSVICNNPIAIPIVASGILSPSFVNSSTTISDLALNAAGNFAGRVEQTTLAARLRPNQQFSVITYIDSGGDSYYNAAQFTLRRQFSNGFGFDLAYTFGKSIDNQSVDPIGTSTGGGIAAVSGLPNSITPLSPADARDFRSEKARSDFDRRHVLNIATVFELPLGKGRRFISSLSPLANQLFGGWSINGIYTYMSGEPFSVLSGVRTSNFSHQSRALVTAPVKANLQDTPGIIGPVLFPNNQAFSIPPPGSNGAGRNIFTAPSYWNLDLGIIKSVNITEQVRLQLRMEMFNAFNHPNFDNPRDATVGSPGIRDSVFGQTCCATVATNTTTNVIQTGEAARVIQFALKLQW